MTNEEERALREQLTRLQQEHRDLDAAITALVTSPGSDLIQIQRLKKRKLILRETPSFLTLHGSQKNTAELGLTRARLDRKIWCPKSAC